MEEKQEGMRLEVGQEERAPVLQWVGLFLPAATFFAHLQIGYVMIPWACTSHQPIWMHVIGIASIVISALGSFAAWRTWMTGGHNAPGDHGGAIARTRMLGAIGVGIG